MFWNVPTYRIRAYLRKKRKAEVKKQVPGFEIHIKRSKAQIAVGGGFTSNRVVLPATVVLNDITLRGLFLFSAHPIDLGQTVTLTVESPKALFVRGRVVACNRLSLQTAVISETVFPYRVGILFEFRGIEDRIAIKKYCDELAQVLRPRGSGSS